MKTKPLKQKENIFSVIPWYFTIIILVFVFLPFLLSPLFLGNNAIAQLFFNFLLALITIFVSAYVTHVYSQRNLKDEITRYGLQAWRNLDSLEVKLLQHHEDVCISQNTLNSWILDVDAAKWAWQDLLKEAFEIQDRLQAETEEIVSRYRRDIAQTSSSEEKLKLEQNQKTELAGLFSRAPLPLKLSEKVLCPNCNYTLNARVGSSAGDSDWPTCPNCNTNFPVFRLADGTIEGSKLESQEIEKPCPKCKTEITFNLYEEKEISFLILCPKCSTHIQFCGDINQQKLIDLGVTNAEFVCLFCSNNNKCWIAPGRKVSFKKNCGTCGREVRITGKVEKFEVTAP